MLAELEAFWLVQCSLFCCSAHWKRHPWEAGYAFGSFSTYVPIHQDNFASHSFGVGLKLLIIEVMKNTLNLYTIYLLKNYHYFIIKINFLKSNKNATYTYLY